MAAASRRRPRRPAAAAFSLRAATRADTAVLVRHRRRMWEDIGRGTRAQLDASDPVYRRWLRSEMAARTLLGFLAEDPDGRVLGSGMLWLQPSQPRPGPLGRARTPYILSMYTEPRARGRGVATAIVRRLLDWCRDHGYGRVLLHASDHGRPVYEALGFVAGREMRRDLRPRRPRRR